MLKLYSEKSPITFRMNTRSSKMPGMLRSGGQDLSPGAKLVERSFLGTLAVASAALIFAPKGTPIISGIRDQVGVVWHHGEVNKEIKYARIIDGTDPIERFLDYNGMFMVNGESLESITWFAIDADKKAGTKENISKLRHGIKTIAPTLLAEANYDAVGLMNKQIDDIVKNYE